jgi:hypothetical protein
VIAHCSPQAALDDLRERLAHTRWPDERSDWNLLVADLRGFSRDYR